MTPQKPIFSEILGWLSPKISLSHLDGRKKKENKERDGARGVFLCIDIYRDNSGSLFCYLIYSLSLSLSHHIVERYLCKARKQRPKINGLTDMTSDIHLCIYLQQIHTNPYRSTHSTPIHC